MAKEVKLRLLGFFGFVQPVTFKGLYGDEVVMESCGTSIKTLDRLFPAVPYMYDEAVIGDIPAEVQAEVDEIEYQIKELQERKKTILKEHALSREQFVALFKDEPMEGDTNG